jgi:hypothetical protein
MTIERNSARYQAINIKRLAIACSSASKVTGEVIDDPLKGASRIPEASSGQRTSDHSCAPVQHSNTIPFFLRVYEIFSGLNTCQTTGLLRGLLETFDRQHPEQSTVRKSFENVECGIQLPLLAKELVLVPTSTQNAKLQFEYQSA